MILLNKIYCMNCIDFMKEIPDEFVDLVYLDPPFFTSNKFDDFNDKWEGIKEYLSWLRPVIKELYRILKNTGSLYLHCDYHANYGIRILLNNVFGSDNFINEIIWCYKGGNARRKFRSKHDTIFLYSKTGKYFIDVDEVRIAYPDKLISGEDEKGKFYKTGQNVSGKVYLHPKGQLLYDYWIDINSGTTSHGKEFVGYDTQKPERLLERIIKASSCKGDLVFDPFLGSGTTTVVAKKLNRNFIGCDINPEAIKKANARLDNIV